MTRQPLEQPDACVDCGGPCTHPTRHRGVDLLAVVALAVFSLALGLALGVFVAGW